MSLRSWQQSHRSEIALAQRLDEVRNL